MSVLRDTRVVVLLVLVLAGSVLSVVLALNRPESERVGEPPALSDGSDQGYRPADLLGPGGGALAAAVMAVPLTYTHDHRDLGAALVAATRQMTPRYAAKFTRDYDRSVRPVARRRGEVTRGVVRGAGVVRASGDTAVGCLLYVDQQVRVRGQRRGAAPTVLARRVLVAMVLRGGTWKIDGIRPL